jgi:16S rRNA (adenine1518-N6/adenine1519-N6)-dimethyltransferase
LARTKRRRLGQNFLVDRGIAQRIVGLLADEPREVLEIGPGHGALTGPLLERFDRVLALELDAGLVPRLEERFPEARLELRVADALGDPVDELLPGRGRWQVASNLPYSVGTAIVRRLLPRHDRIARLVVMLQREVAERIVARPGDRNHGLLALECAARAQARIAFHVSKNAFRPRPKVVSSVVVIDLEPASFGEQELDAAFRLAGHALTRPRKMLRNALLPLCDEPTITAAGLDPRARPGTVPLEGWVALARCVE